MCSPHLNVSESVIDDDAQGCRTTVSCDEGVPAVMGRIRQHVIVVLALCITAACGGGSSSPTAPTPQIVQVAGLWGYTATLTGSTGGGCLAGLPVNRPASSHTRTRAARPQTGHCIAGIS